ncbi:bifunctional [glutamate--ammonia ligase]-adenylyl-L-tyrosine phosphorylase/[glutamate--ammonia-ligase] adenylyltransferase [Altererythrobacter arenosus]|uniref:Bifunctional [glutamate--ammonia ligase]-adenylyl-L-tyrosine phosphorylase/[glutamate--ammonia-ligase] adenylyltransferase n=1 Tax=Altererythrobacter arenosus TaxID=3032592 RepID=A0ABY8FYQ0_9SPHN|nr:bifunctional [glutamate--ammonia ligase]-adenylyl-L-tyrosine phosphorylase/[glutamate--ammonia-ligase] adenylyltransferase [Altererythrobacter sp. CAU 1644]WFL78511.1 bifunctional [glutamate--ammonia ligase]-adenylyl-L-tyrosine phosphorylase/[glutamate--ammonia-ligase] adenylyltransferase [Altererythrobacter sp. CAU 1644]
MASEWQDALARARAEAPFLRRALERQPELADLLERGEGDAALEWARQAGDNAGSVGSALRRERLAYATALAVGDLAGDFPLDQVMVELSDLADRALDFAISEAITRRVESGDPNGMIALALGKHGAHELNYSSDIDPILLYDPQTLPRRERDEPGEAAQRYAREVVKLLSDVTEEGYVFRVDLRLRPASEVSPLAISCNAALTHYESSALAWERAAFIRARAAAGDVEAGENFLAAIRPFVWRSSLDYGAIEEIRRLTTRIRANYKGPVEVGPGFNLKHGRGGIREVEFFAQTHQLIHGGRDHSLRLRGTRAALDALAAAGRIAEEEARVLGDAYDRLRVVEHRLQMVNDRQTHALSEGEALDGVARLDGLEDGAALVAELTELTDRVARIYDTLIAEEDASRPVPVRAEPLAARLDELGFDDPARLAERITGWRDGRYRTLRSSAALSAFDAMLPNLIEALAEADDPDRAIMRWENVLASASSAINLFRLIEARPALLDQLVAILTLAPTLADELGRRPELLDTLIDRTALDLPGTVEQLAARMRGGDAGGDYERQLDRIRVITGEVRFAIGLQMIEAVHDPLAIAAALSRTAEAALQVAHDAAEAEFARQHGRIVGSELLVLGLGRLGGGALTHASDLDIIHIFTGDSSAESDGPRPLGGTLYYNRLAQRVGAALSVPTAHGALYEVDTRLRPQGAQGPLAASLESFAKYQREAAWTWEHMALTRARVLVASDAARVELQSIIDEVLRQERDPVELRADVLKMRAEMAQHKPAQGPLDAKLARGALVDLEFLIHFLQLRERTAFTPDLGEAIAQLGRKGFLPESLVEAHALMTRLLVAGRLLAPDLQRPSPAAALALARACQVESFDDLLQFFGEARQGVAATWADTFGEALEIER